MTIADEIYSDKREFFIRAYLEKSVPYDPDIESRYNKDIVYSSRYEEDGEVSYFLDPSLPESLLTLQEITAFFLSNEDPSNISMPKVWSLFAEAFDFIGYNNTLVIQICRSEYDIRHSAHRAAYKVIETYKYDTSIRLVYKYSDNVTQNSKFISKLKNQTMTMHILDANLERQKSYHLEASPGFIEAVEHGGYPYTTKYAMEMESYFIEHDVNKGLRDHCISTFVPVEDYQNNGRFGIELVAYDVIDMPAGPMVTEPRSVVYTYEYTVTPVNSVYTE